MSNKNNIFISWSKERSLYAAKALYEWLPNVIQAADPWISDVNIDKGAKGLVEVGKALEGKQVGIVCLTPENLNEPWILYEAGALSKAFSDDSTRLYTYLVSGLKPEDVKPPLGMFQWTKSDNKEDTRKLIHSINVAVSETPLPQDRLDKIFDMWWPTLEEKLKQMPKPSKIVDVTRSSEDMLSEILDLCRRYLPNIGSLRPGVLPPNVQIVAPPHPAEPALEWKPSGPTIWVKRKGKDDLEYVEGKSYLETPSPSVLKIYRGTGILAEFDDVEEWGHWGDGSEVRAKYQTKF